MNRIYKGPGSKRGCCIGYPDQGNANAAYWVALINIIVSILVVFLYIVIIALAVANEGY